MFFLLNVIRGDVVRRGSRLQIVSSRYLTIQHHAAVNCGRLTVYKNCAGHRTKKWRRRSRRSPSTPDAPNRGKNKRRDGRGACARRRREAAKAREGGVGGVS